MKIFVTGGTGFIGSWLVPYLSGRGHEVMVLTRNPQDHEGHGGNGAVFSQCDLGDGPRLRKALVHFGPHALVHLGWEGLPDYSPETCLQNFQYSMNLFSMAAEVGCPCILSTGSCWEYASRKGHLSEESPLGGVGLFPAVKNSLRFMGEAIARDKGALFYWLRLFFVYGPGQRTGSLITHIIESIWNNQAPQIQLPDNRNDFLFVADAVQGITEVLEQQPANPVYNLGSGIPTSVEEVVRTTYALFGKPYDRDLLTKKRNSPEQDFWADISRITRDTDWQPHYDIELGIKETMESLSKVG